MPASADIQAATLNKFLASWREGSAPDTMALWSDDFKQRLLPLSLGESSFRSRDQAAFFYPVLVENLRNWELHIKEIVHDSARGTAAVYATSQADTPFPGEKWTNEYALFLSFSEDGTKAILSHLPAARRMFPRTYAVLGSTGNCGTALIENLLKTPDARIHAYCRNRPKLLQILPDIKESDRVSIFEGNIQDGKLLQSCLRNCHAIFLVVSTNDNIPGCHLAQDTATAVIQALQDLKRNNPTSTVMPKLVLLSSATTDSHLSRDVPSLLRFILHRSASYVYEDLVVTEKLLHAQKDWLTSIFIKPGALSVDIQRGHALSRTDQDGPLSYLDLAAAMIEAADEETGCYDMQSLGVVNTNGRAKFPAGTPLCILVGLLRHYFPFLHPYLPMNTGPR
ncbi:hypothetical protein CNMCM8694_002283 [Aspergillus lentulus]|nr:hypothetical protein CNMCM8060_003757 [Aspergillus lentulus]KAF4191199.1 hypothetical protein CNMCM8694_002283 [Aspergillus lentulus]